MEQLWSTSDVAARHRHDYWRDAICRTFVKLDVVASDRDRFSGRVGSTTFGPLRLCFIQASPMDVFRTRHNIAQLHEDDLLVGLHVDGVAHGKQDGRQTALRPGDFALFDATRPYRVDFCGDDRFLHLVLQFPRAMLEQRTRHTVPLTARAADRATGTGRLTSRFLLDLARHATTTPDHDRPRIAEHAVDLVALALDSRADAANRDDVRIRIIHNYIDEHLADADLSPESIAAAHHISVRSLYNLFKDHDEVPVTAWIQRRRFERIRRDLRDPRCSALTIAAIGQRHGVDNAAYLSRGYRHHFSVSPSADRAARIS